MVADVTHLSSNLPLTWPSPSLPCSEATATWGAGRPELWHCPILAAKALRSGAPVFLEKQVLFRETEQLGLGSWEAESVDKSLAMQE